MKTRTDKTANQGFHLKLNGTKMGGKNLYPFTAWKVHIIYPSFRARYMESFLACESGERGYGWVGVILAGNSCWSTRTV